MTHLAPAFTRTKYDEAATLQYDQTSQSPFEWITANLRPGECFQAQSPLLSSTLGMSPESVNNETEIQAIRNHSLSKTMVLSNPVHSYNPSSGRGCFGLLKCGSFSGKSQAHAVQRLEALDGMRLGLAGETAAFQQAKATAPGAWVVAVYRVGQNHCFRQGMVSNSLNFCFIIHAFWAHSQRA
jgi:hypothetical protein